MVWLWRCGSELRCYSEKFRLLCLCVYICWLTLLTLLMGELQNALLRHHSEQLPWKLAQTSTTSLTATA